MSQNPLRMSTLLVGLLTAGLSVSAFAQSTQFPTYNPGENLNGTQGPSLTSPTPQPWVASDGAILTPAGTQVYLGITTRAKAVAINPLGNHTAAVLQMSAPQAVTIFNTLTGAVIQNVKVPNTTSGNSTGIAYTSDGSKLLFSQDSHYVAHVTVNTTGPNAGQVVTTPTTTYGTISLPYTLNASNAGCTPFVAPFNTSLTSPSGSPNGSSGGSGNSAVYPCGSAYSGTSTSYPLGLAIDPANAFAYSVLDVNDTLAKINLSTNSLVGTVRVGQVPNSVVISPDGTTAYVSNEAGRIPTATDFQEYSDGSPVVASYPTGSTASGTVSVINLSTFTKTADINVGLHPTGMAFWNGYLLVANTYSETISVVDTHTNTVAYTINVGLPIATPGSKTPAFGAGPNSIAVDAANNIAYVALYNANAVAVVNLVENAPGTPIKGMIPVGYAPSSVVLDAVDGRLIVANDKGIGTTGFQSTPAENSTTSSHGVGPSLNTHEDLGTVSLIPVPVVSSQLSAYTKQTYLNNHWDLGVNIQSAAGGSPTTAPVAIPAKLGDPSLIKHIFVIIRENRTYDQILGDVVNGNGAPNLAIFGDGATAMASTTSLGKAVTPNAHTLVQRFPLFDNFYDPSRQSADGHNWIVQAMAPYSDDIQSPAWVRDYPSNGGDAIAYQPKGNLYNTAVAAGRKIKNYGEYIEYDLFNTPTGSSAEPPWNDWYRDTSCFDAKTFGSTPGYALPNPSDCQAPGVSGENSLYYQNTVISYSPLPDVINNTVSNYPQFDLLIPDQFRFDIWWQDFQKDVAANSVPSLEFMWISSDHTGTSSIANAAQQADNDLAMGRFVDAISHSPIWSSSAIFVEEDDAQDGIDHVDGHRSPGYVISPYVKQGVNPDGTGTAAPENAAVVDSTFYTQVNFTRTIEQILGIPPMNQFDLVASPMYEIFTSNPPANNFLPWNHVANQVPLDEETSTTYLANLRRISPKASILAAGWLKKKAEIFNGNYHKPDVEDADTVRHFTWYEATNYMTPYPGEKKVRPASDFNNRPKGKGDVDD